MIKALIFLTAGVTLGLLLAPEKGTEMRKKLLGKFDDAKKNTNDFLGNAANKTEAENAPESF